MRRPKRGSFQSFPDYLYSENETQTELFSLINERDMTEYERYNQRQRQSKRVNKRS